MPGKWTNYRISHRRVSLMGVSFLMTGGKIVADVNIGESVGAEERNMCIATCMTLGMNICI